MRKVVIAVLLCVNLALLAGLLLLSSQPRAQAQGYGGVDYIMVPGQVQANSHAIYVLDVNRQTLAAIQVDRQKKAAVPIGRRDITND